MDKSYFKTRKAEIQSEIDSWKQKMRDLENEYISSNQKFPIGSKVCVTIPAHTFKVVWNGKKKSVPEEKIFAYISGYEVIANNVVPIFMKMKKNGEISKKREYLSLYDNCKIDLAE